MAVGCWAISAAADDPDGPAPACGWRSRLAGGTFVVLVPDAAGCPDVPAGYWVAAAEAAAADTARAVTAVALAGLPCSAEGLRCRARAAGPEGRLWVAGGCDGLRCRAGGVDTLESSGRSGRLRSAVTRRAGPRPRGPRRCAGRRGQGTGHEVTVAHIGC